jgi:hypothetical protein
MRQQLALGRKTFRIIATLLLVGCSLLFTSCEHCGDNPLAICTCCTVEVGSDSVFVIQYLDCNGDIKSVRVANASIDAGTDTIDECERIIKISPAQ